MILLSCFIFLDLIILVINSILVINPQQKAFNIEKNLITIWFIEAMPELIQVVLTKHFVLTLNCFSQLVNDFFYLVNECRTAYTWQSCLPMSSRKTNFCSPTTHRFITQLSLILCLFSDCNGLSLPLVLQDSGTL